MFVTCRRTTSHFNTISSPNEAYISSFQMRNIYPLTSVNVYARQFLASDFTYNITNTLYSCFRVFLISIVVYRRATANRHSDVPSRRNVKHARVRAMFPFFIFCGNNNVTSRRPLFSTVCLHERSTICLLVH